MATFHQVQTDPYSLSGAGAVIGATTIILQSFQTIDGVNLAMSDFGTIGYGTLDPGNGTLEEQISFSGVTQNTNGTATLTGVKTVLFISPYTETSGLAKTHAGSTAFVISNTAGFYNQFPAKVNDETITGQWTFTNTPIVPGVVSDASTTVKGVSKTSVAPATANNPIVVGTNDPRVPVGYAVDSVGTDSYSITPTPAITAYTAGQMIAFQAGTANTGAATLAVSGLAPIAIKKEASQPLATGDILAGQIVTVIYDGTNFQLEGVTPTSISTRISALETTEIYTEGALSNAFVKTYFNVQMLFTLWTGSTSGAATTDFTNWQRSSTEVEVLPGAYNSIFAGTGSEYLYVGSPLVKVGGTGSHLSFADTNTVIMDWFAYVPATSTGDFKMGFSHDNAELVTAYNSTTGNSFVGFAQSAAGVMYATIMKNGVGVTNTAIANTPAQWNNYRIELDLSNNALFYINGVLLATLSGANMPSSNALSIGFGRSNTATFYLTAPNVALQVNG